VGRTAESAVCTLRLLGREIPSVASATDRFPPIGGFGDVAEEVFAGTDALVDAILGLDAGHALEFVEYRRPDDG